MFNFPILLLAALVPLAIGFVWYNPKVFGNVWMKSAGLTEESMKGANMALVFGITYVLSIMLAMALTGAVIHQRHVFSILIDEQGFHDPNSPIHQYFQDFMAKYGHNFRTFKHGALHGTLEAVFFALPVLAINALFERKGFKYIGINLGYWIITLALMGGIICQFH